MTTTSLSVKGMGCSGCVNSVENALKGLDGVVNVKVELDSATALITYDENKTGVEQFSEAVSDAGYSLDIR